MNFLDPTLDIGRAATPNPESQSEQPSLNEEVNQVIGQLGKFWGGFKKQSQTALESARKDFSDVVIQAQKELTKLTIVAEPVQDQQRSGGDVHETGPNSDNPKSPDDSTTLETPTTRNPSVPESSSFGISPQNLLSRLQSTLPPAIVSTVQNNINSVRNASENLMHASESIDFQQLRTNMLSDLQRVQGVTLAQAEDYYHKSEALLREAMKEAGEVLRDAVKVVPPEEGSSAGGQGMLWDGTDMWMLPYENSDSSRTSVASGKEKAGTSKAAESAAVATRAEALLRRLKHDASILRHNPEGEDGIKDAFISWRQKEIDSVEGGLDSATWRSAIDKALGEVPDGEALKRLEDTLVPSEMDRTAFWQRFFFRSHQIRIEEQKRKALISSSTETDEDFSWEDDEDDASPIHTNQHLPSGTNIGNPTVPSASEALATDASKRRVNSEDSFDLVSSTSKSASVVGDTNENTKPKADDDEDSDWE